MMEGTESASSASAQTKASARKPVASKPKVNTAVRKAAPPAPKPKQTRNKIDPMVMTTDLLKEKGMLTRRLAVVDRKLALYGGKLKGIIDGLGLPASAVKRAARKAKHKGTTAVEGGYRLNGDGSATAAVMVAEAIDISGGVARESITKSLDGKMKGIAITQSLAKLYKWGDAEKQETANGERIALTAQGQAKLKATHAKQAAASAAPANGAASDAAAGQSASSF